MATPRRPKAMHSATSLASFFAVKDFPQAFPHLVKKRDAVHEWIPDWGNQQLVDYHGEPHLLTPLRKVYLDPYGLRELVPPKPKLEVCPLCNSMMVSQ